ncbi:MAG: DUF1700 domain-containing protein [Oscillospiraceae bacterium]|nr:DUF1700 domain-containing protein [Oscillospiraceae bacterium]
MTRSEYLSELASHLISLSKEERDMAVGFYEEYFDEAGPENEQVVIAELGKPFNLARSIIGETSLYSQSMVYLKYKESKPMPQNNTSVFASLRKPDAFEETVANTVEEDIKPNGTPQNMEQDVLPNANQESPSGMFDEHYVKDVPPQPDAAPKQSSNTALIVILIVIGLIFGFPLIIALAGVIFAIFVVMFVFGFVSAVCFIASIIALITGIIQFPASVPNGIGFICAALISAGIGMVMLSASLAFFFKLVPFTFKGIRNLFRKRRAE